MEYKQIRKGRFLSRPNRFVAYVEFGGKTEPVHVKNTGRCRELLQKGAEVYVEASQNPARKTGYDLVAVKKGSRLVNMDSMAPNRAVGEWLAQGGLFPSVKNIRPETVYGNSRFDFYVETDRSPKGAATETEGPVECEPGRILIEVKGVTLEEDGVVLFPDAPSERAVKHVRELIRARAEGYETYVLFVIQMTGVSYFTPNAGTHPAFCQALRDAAGSGVHILAYDCHVWERGMAIRKPVEVRLTDCITTEKTDTQSVSTKQPERGGKGEADELPLADLMKPLLCWYDKSHRILPWRDHPTAYRVWISEIMLQQTRVAAVMPYYERFLEALPDVAHLAAVADETLLKLWEGLGYYNRARNLKKAAIKIMEEHGGQMPESYEALLALPGIGSYTAGAIASIAYGLPYPAVDGNVLRILARVRMDDGDIMDEKVRQGVRKRLLEVMPGKRAGDLNQALMELGAVVCVPGGVPKCGECPWGMVCRARAAGQINDYPKKSGKKARTVEKMTVLILQDENRTALRKRPESGLLAGMYEFPSLPGHRTKEETLSWLSERGYQTIHIRRLEDARHIFTHKEWHMIGYAVRVDELERPSASSETGFLFAEAGESEEKYPIPSAFSAYAKYAGIHLGHGKKSE